MSTYFNPTGGINGNDHISGRWGELFDEDGREFGTTQSFEANIELDKEEINIPRRFMRAHKVTGASGTGSVSFNKIDTRLQKKLLADPYAKFNYVGTLDDPTVDGKDRVLFRNLSFDSIPVMMFEVDGIVALDMDFTFEGVEYLETIKD